MSERKSLALAVAAVLSAVSLLGSALASEIPGIVAPNDADYGVMLIDDLDEAQEKIIYVKADGSLENTGASPEDALPTLSSAVTALGLDGGTVMIVGEVGLDRITTGKKADGQKRVTITGYDDDSTLIWSTSFNPNCDITIEYLNIVVAKNWSYLNARGNDLILGKGIYVTRAEGVSNDMVVRGGGDTNTNIEGDTNITVYSGTYTQICGGSRNGIIYGDTHITVYGGFITGLNGGNNNGSEPEAKERNVEGDSYITIYGGEVVNCDGAESRSIVKGTRHLDVSRYANFNPKWFSKFDEVKEYDPSLAPAVVEIPEVKAEGAFIKGYEDNTFRPQNNITRAEAITVLSRLLVNDSEIAGKYTSAYSDMKSDKWYYSNVAYLESIGALEELTERGNKILPEQPITRIEVCQLVAYIGKIKEMKIVDFTDLDTRTAKNAIYALASRGIINGYDNGDGTFRFAPEGTITRAEFVTIIDRFLGRKANSTSINAVNKFTDTSDHWAKEYILCASSEKIIDGKEIWSVNMEKKSFELSDKATTSAQYITELKEQSGSLTVESITDGIDMIAKKRIEEIRGTKTDITVKGTAYYVSENGDDTNDGKTPETAWKSLSRVGSAPLSAGDVVFFKRGDTFRGQLKTKSGVTYSAYGEGAKPNIFGWNRNSADETLWEETEVKGVWKYAESVTEDIGNIIFNDSIHTRKVIRSTEKDGKHLDYRAGREFNTYKDLTENLTFFHDSPTSAESAPSGAEKGTGYVYLRCNEGNPGKIYDSIEMAKKVHVISNSTANNVRIDNLCVAYGGAHGISAGKCDGLTVTNCEFKWIGGSLQTQIGAYNRTWPTPYGNAIEIYGEAKNYTVDNCYIWQAYDAGVTHQGSNTGNLAVENVRYTNNVIEKCVYAVEIFYGESTNEKDVRGMDGVFIENNLLRMGGGFGHYQRPDTGVTALIRNGGILNNTTNFYVRNNIFDRSLGKIVQAGKDGGSKAMYYDNLYVQKLGSTFCTRLGLTYTADENISSALTATGTEFDGTFILVEDFGY